MASLKDLIVMGPARFLDKIYGNLEGNATSADKLKTARSITLTGTVNGTAAFDGSSNIAITTSLAKNYAGSSSDGGVANNSNFLNRKAYLTSAEEMDNFLDITGVQFANFKTTEDSGIGFGSNDGMLLSLPWSSTAYGAQIAFDDTGAGNVSVRGKTTSWGSWHRLLHSGNYTNYTVTKTGSGASGNWGINITGSAAKLTTARTINGTSFDGSGNITTAHWGTARNITIGNKTQAINGNTNYTYTHLDIGLQDGYFRNVTRDFTDGTLIQTNIDYSQANGAPWSLEIKGNSYGSYYPFLLQYQGYIYNDTIIRHGGNMYGYSINGLVAFNYDGKLCFWFPRQGYWQGFAVLVLEEWNSNAKTNSVTSITNSTKPSGITKEVVLDNFHYYLHNGNYSSYLDSRYVTLSTSQTITAAKTLTSNWNFKTANYTSTPITIYDDATTYGHTLLVGAGGTTYIGAGEASGTLYSILAVKSTEDLILGADSNIRFHTGADSATTTSGITLNASNQFYPQTNNAGSLGTSSYKWGSIYSNKGYFGGTSTTSYALNTASFICDSWIRTKGASGWYNEDYGGGWYMEDSNWIRAYNNKKVYVSSTETEAIYTSGSMRASKGFSVDNSMTVSPSNSNELNFGGTNTSTTIYFGYRAVDSRPIPTKYVFSSSGGTASLQCNTVYLGSGTSSYVSSSQYTGNAATATKATQDASSNTITTSYLRRYDWWTSGNGNDVDTLRAGTTFAYSNHNAPTTGTIVAFDCRESENYGLQIMGDYHDSTNHLHFRNRNGDSNKWGAWRTILDDNNYTSYTVTKTGSGASGTWGISITGNAATATAFSTNRTIALTGDVTGSASTNGSSGWSISTTVADDSHNHIISNVDGLQTALDNKAGGSNYIDITVGGDANTYYPVVLTDTSSYYPMQFVNISRTYYETAPDSWNNSTHKGGLTMTLLWNGSRYWDGNGSGSPCYCVHLTETYSTMVGGLGNSTAGIVIWLRGGTAKYHIHSLNGKAMSATVYTSTFTDSASQSFAPTTSPSAVTVKWPGAITGNAATATKLATARTIRTNLASTSTASFDGSGNITPGVTGTLGIGNGGTGATTKLNAKSNLGISYGTTLPTSGMSEGDIFFKIG